MEGTYEIIGTHRCGTAPNWKAYRYEQLLPWVKPTGVMRFA